VRCSITLLLLPLHVWIDVFEKPVVAVLDFPQIDAKGKGANQTRRAVQLLQQVDCRAGDQPFRQPLELVPVGEF
jgi:hypothetical protein